MKKQQSLPETIDSTSSILDCLSGKEYFHELVKRLSNLINSDCCFIAEISDDGFSATTISLYAQGKVADNISYELVGTPCKDLSKSGVCFISNNITKLYPDDKMLVDMNINAYIGVALKDRKNNVVGIMAALFENEVTEPNSVTKIFDLFIHRAWIELERLQYENNLEGEIEELNVAHRIYSKMADGVIITDKENRIIYVNESLGNMRLSPCDEIMPVIAL